MGDKNKIRPHPADIQAHRQLCAEKRSEGWPERERRRQPLACACSPPSDMGFKATFEEEAIGEQKRQDQERPKASCVYCGVNRTFDIDQNRGDIGLAEAFADLLHKARKTQIIPRPAAFAVGGEENKRTRAHGCRPARAYPAGGWPERSGTG